MIQRAFRHRNFEMANMAYRIQTTLEMADVRRQGIKSIESYLSIFGRLLCYFHVHQQMFCELLVFDAITDKSNGLNYDEIFCNLPLVTVGVWSG